MEFRKLNVYSLAIKFTKHIYELSNEVPNKERFGLINQLRRASVSIVLNIAEGSGSSSKLEFSRFLKISIRSLYEVDAILELLVELNYCKKERILDIYRERIVLGKMLGQFIKKLKT